MFRRMFRERAGSAVVELAVVLPVLVLILVGAMDFGRIFYLSMSLNSAARAGVQFGAQSLAMSTNTAGMEAAAATAAAASVGTITASATRVCGCATATNAFVGAVACGASCGGGEHMTILVSVTTSAVFNRVTPFPIPGVPASSTITRNASMRVQ